jgi:hypothetical protein
MAAFQPGASTNVAISAMAIQIQAQVPQSAIDN